MLNCPWYDQLADDGNPSHVVKSHATFQIGTYANDWIRIKCHTYEGDYSFYGYVVLIYMDRVETFESGHQKSMYDAKKWCEKKADELLNHIKESVNRYYL